MITIQMGEYKGKFDKKKKYEEGDEVEYKGAKYRVKWLYSDGTAETLECACDLNKVGSHCSNCSDEYEATEPDEDGNMEYEWTKTGYLDKANITLEA